MERLTVWRAAAFKKRKQSQRGSVFIEAALILPIVILALSMIIAYAAEGYEGIKQQTERRNAQREASMDDGRIDKRESEFVRNIDFLLEEI